MGVLRAARLAPAAATGRLTGGPRRRVASLAGQRAPGHAHQPVLPPRRCGHTARPGRQPPAGRARRPGAGRRRADRRRATAHCHRPGPDTHICRAQQRKTLAVALELAGLQRQQAAARRRVAHAASSAAGQP
jgi:hypothetical protein